MFVALIKAEEKICLVVNDDGQSISGWETKKAALSTFEDAYNENHARSHEASMSACLHFIQFQPRVWETQGEEELEERLLGPGPWHVTNMRAVSGSFRGIEYKRLEALKVYEEAFSPDLVKQILQSCQSF